MQNKGKRGDQKAMSAIKNTRMWISSDNCKSGPGRTEFENVLFIALERWEWHSPKAYCTHVKATNLLVEQLIKMYWNLSLTWAKGGVWQGTCCSISLARGQWCLPGTCSRLPREYEGAQWGLADESVSFSWQLLSLKQLAMDSPSGKDLFCVSVFCRAIHFPQKSCLRPIRCQAWDRSGVIHP